MELIREACFEEILEFFASLGSFDREDANNSLSGYQHYYFVSLDEGDFLDLVFLANDEVRPIVPHGGNRQLRAVAERAITIKQRELSFTWNLDAIDVKFKEFNNSNTLETFPPLVLRDLRDGEVKYRPAKYIHDGCHRSLGLAMAILLGDIKYMPVGAYLCTDEFFDN